jgi:putative photosynthetic complex assembly protein
MSAMDAEPFPRVALIAASVLVGVTLFATAAVRLSRIGAPPETPSSLSSAPYRSIELRFVDEANGSVSVHDGRTDKVVGVLPAGSDGFIRSVMRGMVHERKRRGIGPEQPFLINQWANGRLALQDTTTGRLIDLEAFGEGNKDAFARLLPKPGAPT